MSIATVLAVAAADFRIRFRRTSTLVVFTLLSAVPLFWIASPSTGKVVMQMGGKRVLYNSAAIGMATAMLGMLFIGLAGYFVVSNAIRRDAVTRCGFVLASTPMRSIEYLAGKFAGNVVFLSTFVGGFMAVSMIMQVLRGDVALEPMVFVEQYLLLTPPIVVFVSVMALVFETVPFLSGRLGDAAYFFAWVTSGGVVSAAMSRESAGWMRYLDVTGMSFVSRQLKDGAEASIHVGLNRFDPAKGVAVFHGLNADGLHTFERLVATLAPLPLLLIAVWAFHRFDPVRVKQTGPRSGDGWIARVNGGLRPMMRPLAALLRPGDGLTTAVRADAWLTFAMQPLFFVAVIGIALFGLVTPPQKIAGNVLPMAMLGAGIAVADITTREQRHGMTSVVFTAPTLRERFIGWKSLATLAVGMSFVIVPILRMALAGQQVISAVTGTLFLTAAATFLGTISRNPKTFLFLFFSLWYFAVSGKGATPAIDFAGFFRQAELSIELAWTGAALAPLAAASAWHRRQLMIR